MTAAAAAPGLRALPHLASVCRKAVENRFVLGIQLHVRHDGETVADAAVGQVAPGVPASPSDVGQIRCAGKPLSTVAVARAVDEGLLNLDDRLGRWAPAGTATRVADITVRSLLTHAHGLPTLATRDVYEHSFDDYVGRLLTDPPAAVWWDPMPIYSFAAGWHLLGWVLQQVHGMPVDAVVAERVTRPLGLHDTALADRAGTARPSYRRTPDGYAPVSVGDPEACRNRPNPAFGAVTTMRDLASFYAALGDVVAGRDVGGIVSAATLGQFLRPGPRLPLLTGQPPKPFAVGLFLGGAAAGFSTSWPDDAFGHAGGAGHLLCTGALCSPGERAVVAVRLSSIGLANNRIITAIGSAVRADLGLPSRSGS